MKNQYILLNTRKYHKKMSKISRIIKLFKNKKIIIRFFTISILFFSIFLISLRKFSVKQNKETGLNFANNITESNIISNTENIILNFSIGSSITLNFSNEIINNTNENESFKIVNIINKTFNLINDNTSNTQYSSNINDRIEKAPYPIGKLFWRNNPTTNIMKVKQEIKSYSNFQISFKNDSDFIKRENPKITVIIAVHDQ